MVRNPRRSVRSAGQAAAFHSQCVHGGLGGCGRLAGPRQTELDMHQPARVPCVLAVDLLFRTSQGKGEHQPTMVMLM